MRRTVITLIIVIFFSLAFAGSIDVFSDARAMPGTNRVTVSWITKVEDGVHKFVILRSSDDVNYIELTKLNAKGPGTQYEYIDANVMFNDISPLFYKIRAIDKSGKTIDETSLIVHPNISGIFRTWGAIKAMFR